VIRTSDILFVILLFPFAGLCQMDTQTEFQRLNQSGKWELVFDDTCTQNWKQDWFLDGLIGTVTNSASGMELKAGPENGNDAHHIVLWTKQSFKGDLKIEFYYTRTDTATNNVNILYIEATGVGDKEHPKDISTWNELRQMPAMKTYFQNMNALHVSFAAFTNVGPKDEYIRARRYPVSDKLSFKDTEILPAITGEGLFITGIPYKITVIKTLDKLYFKVDGDGQSRLCSWDTTIFPPVTEGRIGIRHMFTRSAIYKDFKVYETNMY